MPDDKAWAEFKTPLDPNSLFEFCKDIERLFRINPYLVINDWEQESEYRYKLCAINHSQTPAFELQTLIETSVSDRKLQLKYSNGVKEATEFVISEDVVGSKLTITDTYNQTESKSDLKDVDKSLNKWAEEIQAYLISWKKWSWFLPWRLYKEKIWLPMRPTARRITYMLILISIIEIALIILGVFIYFVEYR